MGDARISSFPSRDSNRVSVDPYALVQAIIASSGEGNTADSDRAITEYDDLTQFEVLPTPRLLTLRPGDGAPQPDEQPRNVRVGCTNPYALVEAILGRRIDRNSVNAATLISQVLQTDYDELFDMRHRSVLYAGLELDERGRRADRLSEKDMRLLRERDLITPDLSRVQRLRDLEQQLGLKDLAKSQVKHARIANGKIRLVIEANSEGNRVARQVTNREVTRVINDLITPFRLGGGGGDNDDQPDREDNQPPNGSWRDMYDHFYMSANQRLISDVTNFRIGDGRRRAQQYFDDPEQGATANSWLIAALFSVFWADPARINRATRVHPHNESAEGGGRANQHMLRVRLHDKGGNNNNRTETVEVNYEIPVTNSNSEPVYARASDRTDIWPCLYEKAFAKWISGNNSDRPNITVTHSGDPVKAMAQINGREPQYYRCEKHSDQDLLGVVRQNCVNNRTINPMSAWTYATGPQFRGSNLVANHAYSVCGYAVVGDRQYIVVRNPWGVTEPQGLTSYPGVLSRMDPELWQPAELLDQGGLFAMETTAFKEAFQYLGVAK